MKEGYLILDGKYPLKKGIYKDYLGQEYTVMGKASHSETGELMVMYKARGDYRVMVKPYHRFIKKYQFVRK